jgi:hypothetical protein
MRPFALPSNFEGEAKDLIFSSTLTNFLSLSDPSSADNETLSITFIPVELDFIDEKILEILMSESLTNEILAQT